MRPAGQAGTGVTATESAAMTLIKHDVPAVT